VGEGKRRATVMVSGAQLKEGLSGVSSKRM